MNAALNSASDESPSAFSGASILPEQYYGTAHDHRFEGERNLLVALLEDAIRCYLDNCNERSPLQRIQYVEAHDWIFSLNDRGAFSFVNVCQNLDIEPDLLRAGLRRRHARLRCAAIARRGASASAGSGQPLRRRGKIAARS